MSPRATSLPAQDTAVALSRYAEWLGFERSRALRELHGETLGAQFERHLVVFGPTIDWHHAHPAAPSTRMAAVLAAAGFDLGEMSHD